MVLKRFLEKIGHFPLFESNRNQYIEEDLKQVSGAWVEIYSQKLLA